MYDIRQFKPALFVLIFLGMTGFALAAQSPGVWALSMSALVVNAWLVKTKQFKPIPHWLATSMTLIALVILAAPLRLDPTRAVLVIGEFLVVLQLVKLYEIRANRDYAQLLVLSLLLMVAASINTASLIFGLLLIIYLFLSLYCCLLFHLKVETDFAKSAIGLPEDIVNPVTLRQDQQHLTRSMRRLTLVVSIFAVAAAVVVFLLFPRGAGAGMLGPLQLKPSDAMTGFSDTVSFQKIAEITQNNQEIAWVKVWKDDEPIRPGEPLMLRGTTLDIYNADDPTVGPTRQWRRSPDENFREVDAGRDLRIVPDHPRWRQEITLNPTGTPVLFALPGLCQVGQVNGTDARVRFWPHDQVLQATDSLQTRISYTVESNEIISNAPAYYQFAQQGGSDGLPPSPGPAHVRLASQIDPAIAEYARRPEVSGSDAQGPLAARRPKDAESDSLDPQIAENIEHYLKTNFTYTLDLTDAKSIGDRDPMVAFLYDFKRGHCEYFAGAMTLMCQSLGMQARMVVGFKCDEYNPMMHCYVVSQNQAHAWVEVLDPTGNWRTYDPTSGRGADQVKSNTGLLRRTMHLLQYLEYTWANNIVAYDRESRANLINGVDRTITTTAADSTATMGRFRKWVSNLLDAEHIDRFASDATNVLFVVLFLVLLGAITWFIVERLRLRRRAQRIGLDVLPASDKNRLLRQLGFYDELLLLLDRHHVRRSLHLTPMEFSQSLTFLPNEAFDSIRRLTNIFYRVRYGRHELTAAQQRHLRTVISQIAASLTGATSRQ